VETRYSGRPAGAPGISWIGCPVPTGEPWPRCLLPIVFRARRFRLFGFDGEAFALFFFDIVDGCTFDVECGPVGEQDIDSVDIEIVVFFTRLIQSHAKTGGGPSAGTHEYTQAFAGVRRQ
jgi:hypothetical protein